MFWNEKSAEVFTQMLSFKFNVIDVPKFFLTDKKYLTNFILVYGYKIYYMAL